MIAGRRYRTFVLAWATTTPQLFPELHGLDLYEGLLKLSAVPPKVVESLAGAHLRMTHLLAVSRPDSTGAASGEAAFAGKRARINARTLSARRVSPCKWVTPG